MFKKFNKLTLLKSFFEFSNLRINLRISLFIFISVISSLLDVIIIFLISSFLASFTSGIPIDKKIFNFVLSIDSSSISNYYLFVIFCLITYLSKLFINYYNYYLGELYGTTLTRKFLKAYSKVSYNFHLNFTESEFVTYYVEDISKAVGAINASFTFLTSTITFLMYVCYVFFTLPLNIFLSFLIICLINFLCVNLLITKRVVNIGQKIKELNTVRIKRIIDFYSLYKLYKVFGISKNVLNNIFNIDRRFRLLEAKAPFLISLPTITIIYLIYLVGITFLFIQKTSSEYNFFIEYFVSLGLIVQRMIPTLSLILNALNTLELKSIFLLKIYKNFKLMVKDGITEMDFKIAFQNSDNKLFNSEIDKDVLISFKSINFRHKYAQKSLYKSDLNFNIFPNSNLLVTGPSGSGKSTLIDIILSLRKPIKGNIYYNKKFDKISNLISYVPQNNLSIDGTFIDNLLLDNNHIDFVKEKSRINSILKCCLLEDLVNNFSLGLNQRIGYGGIQLSGGQLQRLSIARALYRNCPLLLMDEPTSSLDENTSKLLITNLLNFTFKNSISIIVVSHDSSIFPYFTERIEL